MTMKGNLITSADAHRAAHVIRTVGAGGDLTREGEIALAQRLRATASALADGAAITMPKPDAHTNADKTALTLEIELTADEGALLADALDFAVSWNSARSGDAFGASAYQSWLATSMSAAEWKARAKTLDQLRWRISDAVKAGSPSGGGAGGGDGDEG